MVRGYTVPVRYPQTGITVSGDRYRLWVGGMRDRMDTHTGNVRQLGMPVNLLSAGRVGGTEICVRWSVIKDKVLVFVCLRASLCVARHSRLCA